MANELILVVEDNEQNQKLARDVLQVKGYRVLIAESAEAGLPMALEKKPDLVLMDIHLPGMNGIEALGRLRAAPETQAIPVLAFTASVMPQDRRQITSAGFDGFLAKPINLKEFLDTIAGALARRKA
ncbi:MAG TPA: response regulator [Burkholderiales bacterium]|jgi:two-component system cell cycle response regulator DivK|nr:response regulator [Burkholderiales bacterium]